MLAILGIGAALLGISALVSKTTEDKKKETELSKKALESPEVDAGTVVTSRTTTPLTQEQLSKIPGLQEGGEISESSALPRVMWLAAREAFKVNPLNVGEEMRPEFAEYLRTHQIPRAGEISEPQYEIVPPKTPWDMSPTSYPNLAVSESATPRSVFPDVKDLSLDLPRTDLRNPESAGELIQYARQKSQQYDIPVDFSNLRRQLASTRQTTETLPTLETRTAEKFKLDLAPPELAPATRIATQTKIQDLTVTSTSTDTMAATLNRQELARLTGTQVDTQALISVQTQTQTAPQSLPGGEAFPTGGPGLSDIFSRGTPQSVTISGIQGTSGSPIIRVLGPEGDRSYFVTGEQLVSMMQDIKSGPPTDRGEVGKYMARRSDLFTSPTTGVSYVGRYAQETGQYFANYGQGYEPTAVPGTLQIVTATQGLFGASISAQRPTPTIETFQHDARLQGTARIGAQFDIGHLADGRIVTADDLLHNQSLRNAYDKWEADPGNRYRASTIGENPVFDPQTSAAISAEQQRINSLAQLPVTIPPMLASDSFVQNVANAPFTPPQIPTAPDISQISPLMIQDAPTFHTGGLASDEILAKLQIGERVLTREENKNYDSIPQFHSGGVVSFASGGHVWPAFASGGTVDASSPTYSPPVSSSDSGAKTALEGVVHLSSSMGALAGDVEKVSKGFTALERGTTQTQSATARLSSGLSAASSAVSGFQSILSTFGGGGGSGGGILGSAGGLLGGVAKIAGLFALEQGGIIPSAMRGMIVGGLPSFAQGGILSLLHQQEMVLPAHISNFIQGAAASYTGTRGQAQDLGGGTINNTFHISGVVNSHDVGKLFMQNYGTIMKAFQRGSRNGFETP